jgi:very-short-patch-repair endonuclease
MLGNEHPMPDDFGLNDKELTQADIGQIENADELQRFFAKLRYNVDVRRNIPTAPYLENRDIHMVVNRHELIAVDPDDATLKIYLFEVRSVTASLRNGLARGFLRTNDEKVLLVLTSNYEALEFVLLERIATERQGRTGTPRLTIRPIPLYVNRRAPEAVKVRVLRRFEFTEADSDYQWDKLRSAYVLAEWSEEYFNNRALFSDYYLKQRLTDPTVTSEWDSDREARPFIREMKQHILTARKDYTRQPEQVIRQKLYEPLFNLLGFDPQAIKTSSSSADEPDYLLYAPGDPSTPLAAALTYVWNRNLDDVDTNGRDTETPNEIPGALVVSVLEKEDAPPWVIVTNGKCWRLYSRATSNRATNYYEVDLEETLSLKDDDTGTKAFKYWWLMFRRQAFEGFLDHVLDESGKYAKELGDRLKDRVFVEIFPQFAKGFIAHLRAQGETDPDLDRVFSATMTFLYRLMFILYAESLELLPVSEEKGYGEFSLYRLKRELEREGGKNEANAPGLLEKHYNRKSTDLYENWLRPLFRVIDQGNEQLNMPTYNGGLFSPDTDSGRFLEQVAIPDQYLMRGLDRLTRDEDARTHELVLIDFKSLGVRQLGSIYEGLLEFKLKIAQEKLAVERDGKREVYVPLSKAKKGAQVAVEKGEVYLENDKKERKATGSYYTPDYIVKYIVQHTVGPVLARKFEELTPRLRAAQKGYREYAKLVEARNRRLTPHPKSLSHPTGTSFGRKGRGTSETRIDSPLPSVGEGPGVRGQDPMRLAIPRDLEQRMVEVARALRKARTPSEEILWQALRNRQLDGRKFRRQQPIGAFVLDFFCPEERLAVEVDGPIHESQREADQMRQELIESLGIRVVRLTAAQVETNLPTVLSTIRAAFLPSPGALRRGNRR